MMCSKSGFVHILVLLFTAENEVKLENPYSRLRRLFQHKQFDKPPNTIPTSRDLSAQLPLLGRAL